MAAGRGGAPAPPTVVRRALGRSLVKGEDAFGEVPAASAERGEEGALEPAFRAFGVFDGHGGKQAAAHCAKQLMADLGRGLVALASASAVGPPHMEAAVPELLSRLFVETDRAWCEEGKPSGTTATVAVVSGWEVVVASVGDSDLWLDTGAEIVRVSESHRLGSCTQEQKRVREAGGSCARSEVGGKPVGPLRAWPGGLAMSRTIGDAAAAGVVIAEPGLRRVTVPTSGGRLVLASDGLWDAFSPKAALRSVRNLAAGSAAQRLVKTSVQKRGLRDDITLYVVDILPEGETRFPCGPASAAAGPVAVHAPGEAPAAKCSADVGGGAAWGPGAEGRLEEEPSPPSQAAVSAAPSRKEGRHKAPKGKSRVGGRSEKTAVSLPRVLASDDGEDGGWTVVKKSGRRGRDKSDERAPLPSSAATGKKKTARPASAKDSGPRATAAAAGGGSSGDSGGSSGAGGGGSGDGGSSSGDGGGSSGDGGRISAKPPMRAGLGESGPAPARQGAPAAKPPPVAAALSSAPLQTLPSHIPFGPLNGCFVPELNYQPLHEHDPFAGPRFSFPGAFTVPLSGPDLTRAADAP